MNKKQKENNPIDKNKSPSTKADKKKEDKELDKKLKDTFPASDSTAVY